MDSLVTKNRDNRPYVMAFGIMVIFISVFIVIYYVSTHRVGTGGIVSGIILGFIVLIMVIIAIFHFLNYGNNPSRSIILYEPSHSTHNSDTSFNNDNETQTITQESNEPSNIFIPLPHTDANIQLNPQVYHEKPKQYIEEQDIDHPPSPIYIYKVIPPHTNSRRNSPYTILGQNVQEEIEFPAENIEPETVNKDEEPWVKVDVPDVIEEETKPQINNVPYHKLMNLTPRDNKKFVDADVEDELDKNICVIS